MPHVDDNGRHVASDRPEALRLGMTFYQGAPCCHGHGSGTRYATNRQCVACCDDKAIARTSRTRRKDRERKRAWRARQQGGKLGQGIASPAAPAAGTIDDRSASPYVRMLQHLVGEP